MALFQIGGKRKRARSPGALFLRVRVAGLGTLDAPGCEGLRIDVGALWRTSIGSCPEHLASIASSTGSAWNGV